eukprot:Lankesteria_metandrocarpae@DN8626_c0_g1_i1.p2
MALPNDPEYGELWGMEYIHAPAAWDLWQANTLNNTGSRIPRKATYSPIVAVIDTGVDYLHEDLADNIWINEAEFYGEYGVDDDGSFALQSVTLVANSSLFRKRLH